MPNLLVTGPSASHDIPKLKIAHLKTSLGCFAWVCAVAKAQSSPDSQHVERSYALPQGLFALSRNTVWPAQAYAHLTSKAHCLPRYEAKTIANDLDSWQGLCSQGDFQLPILCVESIPVLSLHYDGLRCLLQQDDVPCHYVCRDMKSLKEH